MSDNTNQSSNSMDIDCVCSSRFVSIGPEYRPDDVTRPIGRSGHCMATDESDFYVFGGYSPRDKRNGIRDSKVLPELWKFNFASQKWIKIDSENIPTTCASACLAVHNKQLFVFGGTGYPFGKLMSNTIKTVKLQKRAKLTAAGENTLSGENNSLPCWHLLETSPMSYSVSEVEDITPPMAYGQSLIFHKGAIYVFGGAIGYYSEAVSDLHKLSIDSMAWERLSGTGKVPNGRYKQEIAIDDNRFYVFGGGRLTYAEGLNNIHIYHFEQNYWTVVDTIPDQNHGYPMARCSFGCSQDGKNVYICGGRHYSDDIDHESLSDVWHLRLDSLQWTKIDLNLPEQLYFHGTAMSQSGSMYVFGGVHTDGFRSPQLYKVRLPFSLPKLSELSWEAVCTVLRKNKAMKRDQLVNVGIPWNFIERVSL